MSIDNKHANTDFMADIPPYPTTNIEHEYKAGQWCIPNEEEIQKFDQCIAMVMMNTEL